MPVNRWQRGRITGTEGVDYVTCSICGDRRRVISDRHLSKHDIDRSKYMEEHKLSPDELIAKAFRVIQSGRDGYQPYSKNQWITAIQKFIAETEASGRAIFNSRSSIIYTPRESEFSVVGILLWQSPD